MHCHNLYVFSLSFSPSSYLQEKFTPVRYFSIDRVFRNETLDATHLAEFHQIEGVVADYGLTLGDLMGVLHQFFTKLGQGKAAWQCLIDFTDLFIGFGLILLSQWENVLVARCIKSYKYAEIHGA